MNDCMTTPNGNGCATTEATPINWTVPRADVLHNGDATTIRMDLPGIEKDALSINVEKNILTVEALPPTDADEPTFLHREFGPVGFRRRFELGEDTDSTRIAAEFKNGVLTLTLPKAAESKPRKIAVQIG